MNDQKKEEQLKKSKEFVEIERVDKNVIEGIDFTMKSGDFMVCIGQVGSGKTSLLFSIMGETNLTAGSCNVQGSIAYVEQEPFILGDSVKNNILFGREFDQKKLEKAIRVSQLTRDI